jgi:hypothetical protein
MISLSLFCVGMVAAGFFFAARQHFATMEFGLKNSELRKQAENLEAERRRLILAKEVSLSPGEIKVTASKLGFREQLVAPPSSTEIKVEQASQPAVPAAEFTSLRSATVPRAQATKGNEEKKLVKTIVQQATAKPSSGSERPRIAAPEAVAVAQPKLSKLR